VPAFCPASGFRQPVQLYGDPRGEVQQSSRNRRSSASVTGLVRVHLDNAALFEEVDGAPRVVDPQ